MHVLHSVSDAHCVDVDIAPTPAALNDLQAQIGAALRPILLLASPAASAQAMAIYAAHTLQQWHLPLPVIAAALLMPYAEATPQEADHYAIVEALTPVLCQCASDAWALAERLAAWRGVQLRQPYSMQLRQLFRQAYLDLPGLPFILLLLADHGARFDTVTGATHSAEERRLAEQTEAVFVPLAEMMGLWGQRRLWLDHAMRVLRPDIHAEIKAQLGPTETYTAQGFKRLLAAPPGAVQHGNRLLLEKARTFLALQQDLSTQARQLGFQVRMWPLEPYAGTLLARAELSSIESQEELITRLTVHVVCPTADDCYRALGLLHRLGKPDMTHIHNRLKDYIVQPKSNGYRELHTVIVYERPATPGKTGAGKAAPQMHVECRICTPEMYRLNMCGVVAALHPRHRHKYQALRTWWNSLERLSEQLVTRYGLSTDSGERIERIGADAVSGFGERMERIGADGTEPVRDADDRRSATADEPRAHSCSQARITEFLEQHEIGTRSHPLYVFTPRGDIKLIADGSTAIDFAYRIHTWVGDHAERMKLNGALAPHHAGLHNGDLVDVRTDEQFPGPDLSWLWAATTPHARAKITRALTARAMRVHAGRSRLEQHLVKVLRYYWVERHFPLLITSNQVDSFLLRKAMARRMKVTTLYEHIDNDRQGRLAQSLVHQIISESLASGLVIAGGEAQGHPSYPSHRIVFCDVCRPVPNEPLVAYDRHLARGLIVHREDAGCAASQRSIPVPVRWVERAEVKDKNLTVFQLTAVDRRELLGDLLKRVYGLPGVSLIGVEANTQRDGSAEVSMLVETSLATDVVDLQNAINQMTDVQRMIAMPPSTTQSLAGIQVAANTYVPNPYTYSQEVYDRLSFYDRAEPIQRILRWLNDPPPFRRMVLHGRRRVGKSSLVRHLQREVLRAQAGPAVTPVLVDCQSFGSGATEQTVANHLVEAVWRSMQMTPPQRGPYEEPFAWLNRMLQEAVKHLGQYRLLLVLDELSHLIDLQRSGQISPSVFNFLRAITNERRDLNWLLILQDTDYFDMAESGAASGVGSLLNGEEIHLQDFPPDEARKLIVEPMSRCGIRCEPHIPQQIIDLTNGNPCLIQALCWCLVERVRSVGRQPMVNSADLDNAVGQVLRVGHLHFEHYLSRLTGLRRALVAATAACAPEGGWMDYAALAAALGARAGTDRFGQQEAGAAIRALQRQGALQHDESIDRVRIPVRLFHRWVKRYIDVDTAVEEWMQRGA